MYKSFIERNFHRDIPGIGTSIPSAFYSIFFCHDQWQIITKFQIILFVYVMIRERVLDYIEPDVVHVLADGRILKTGDKSLALELESRGYDWVREEAAA